MNKEDEIILVHMIITHPAGFDLGNSGVLCVRRYEHPVWAVEEEIDHGKNTGKTKVKEFIDPMNAAKFFVERRHALQLGLDFDIELNKGS